MSVINYGFCDLNIPIAGNNKTIKNIVLQALKMGYGTVALNVDVSDDNAVVKKSKKDSSFLEIPPPVKLSFTKEELKRHGITKAPVILSRLTIKFSQPSSPFLHKSKKLIEKYDIISYSPTTEAAFKHICQSNVDVDIISLDVEESYFRFSRNLLYLAINSDVYFELCYAPCIRSSSIRQKSIQFSHDLHRLCRSLNVIITSNARLASELRNPYDVANLGFLFALSPAASKSAISLTASHCIHCAKMRRTGVSKCSAQVEVLERSTKKGKFSSLQVLEKSIDSN